MRVPKSPVQFEGGVHIHRLVGDMKRSIDFYVTVLGFFYDHGIREMAWLSRGGLLLTLSPEGTQTDSESSAPAQVGYSPECGYIGWRISSTEELEEAYRDFHQRGLALSSPPDPTDGRPWFFLYDPDGHPISFSCVAMDYPGGKLR